MRNQLNLLLPDSTSSKSSFARSRRLAFLTSIVILLGAGALLAIGRGSDLFVPRFQEFSDPEGRFATFNPGGPTDTTNNPFVQDRGTNGRRCVTCHQASDAWSVTPP